MPPFKSVHTTVVTTDTTANSVVVGGASPTATSGTGGIKAGQVSLTAGVAIDGGTISDHGIMMPSAVPAVTTTNLYNNSGVLTWAGTAIPTGSGTSGTLAKFTGTNTVGNSIVTESGSAIAVAGSITATAAAITAGTNVSDSVGTMATIRAGGIGIAAQAQYDMVYASSATQLARVANGTTGQVWTATTSGAPAWANAAAPPKASMSTIFETAGRYTLTTVSGGATPAVGVLGMTCAVTAIGADIASGFTWVPEPSNGISVTPGSGFTAGFTVTTKGTAGRVFLGMVATDPAFPGTAGVGGFIVNHFGFTLVWSASGNATLSGSQADGSTQATTTLDSGITQNDTMVVRVVRNTGNTGYTYSYSKNGSAFSAGADVTTNNPTGTFAVRLAMGVNDNSANTANTTVFSHAQVIYGS